MKTLSRVLQRSAKSKSGLRYLSALKPKAIRSVQMAELAAKLIRHELKNKTTLPLAVKWRLWRQGFNSKAYFIYDLEKNDIRDYLSDYATLVKTPYLNGRYGIALENKLIFYWMMHQFHDYVSEVHGVISGQGQIHLINCGQSRSSIEWIEEYLGTGRDIVVKPVVGGGGKGVLFFSLTDGVYRVDGKVTPQEKVHSIISRISDSVVTEFVTQHEYSARIFPEVTNTVRLLTMWDLDTNTPFIGGAAHRFGTRKSLPVDNWTAGGLCAGINVESGELGPGLAYSDERLIRHQRHPDTGSPIEGVHIPSWPQLRDKILDIAAAFPYIPYIGWDIVVTSTGFKIIEANRNSGMNVLQSHSPILVDPRVRDFYKKYKVI